MSFIFHLSKLFFVMNKTCSYIIYTILALPSIALAAESEHRNHLSQHNEHHVNSQEYQHAPHERIITPEEKAFFNANEKKLGILTTSSGLQYQVLKSGLGRKPTLNSKIKVSYEGRLLNEKVIDVANEKTLHVHELPEGLKEGLNTMSESGKTRFFIPSYLAYGKAGVNNKVPPYSSVIFDVELVEIE